MSHEDVQTARSPDLHPVVPVRVLGVDPGLKCGYALRVAFDGHPVAWTSGVWKLDGNRFEGGGMRFVRLRGLFARMLDETRPDVVAVEEVRMHMGVDAAHLYGGILAIVQEECARRSPPVPYVGVHFSHAKIVATGNGNAKKPEMIAAARARWGVDLSADEADARWIAETAARRLAGAEIGPRKKTSKPRPERPAAPLAPAPWDAAP